MKNIITVSTILLAMLVSGLAQATDFDFDLLPRFHRNQQSIKPEDVLLAQSCEELDEAITYLLPATYNYKPAFNEDPYIGAAIWGTTLNQVPVVEPLLEYAWMYIPYSWFIGYLEEGKRHDAHYHIEKLRRAKAMKDCFVY